MAAEKSAKSITLKVLVDKVNDKVILVEPDSEFVNVLFSFLTIPIANIIRTAGENSVVEGSLYTLGCMKNIYESVVSIYQSAGYKSMLFPRYAAESYCMKLKLEPERGNTKYYYVCSRKKSFLCSSWNYAYGSNSAPVCRCCSERMQSVRMLTDPIGGFVNKESKLMISDDLHVVPSSSSATISLFTKLGVSDVSTTEERIFNISNDQVLSLLLKSLISRTPFSEILLQQKGTRNSRIQPVYCCKPLVGDMINNDGKIFIRLAVSKSGHRVYYAEAGEDFVDLLSSFMTLPLGYILKQMQHSPYPFEGCVDQLYKSVQYLDGKYMRSNYSTELLLNPKLAIGSYFRNSLLEVEDTSYYISNEGFDFLTTDKSQIYEGKPVQLNVDGRGKHAVGFLKGSRMFTVTDDLIVKPVSPTYELSILNKSKVHLDDIKHHTVNVGKKEALRLLVASFVGNSALTDAFTRVPIRKNRRPKLGAQWLDLFCMR